MFYEEIQINNSLNCKLCTKRLDKPNILPCGGIICTFCVLSKKMVNNLFECSFCASDHIYPSNGFPLCEPLVQILSVKPSELQRSESVKQLYELQKKIEAFKLGLNNGSKQIKDYCADLKFQVQTATDATTHKLNLVNKKLIDHINLYEQELVNSSEENKNEHRDEYNKINAEIEKLTKQYESNESNVFSTIEIYRKLEEEKIKLDEIIFNKNYLKFEPNNCDLNETILIGSLVRLERKKSA